MYDVSVTPASEIVSAVFKWSHLVLASTTYNAGIFVTMEALISDLVAHNIRNRTAAIIENGSWAATSGELIRKHLDKLVNINVLNNVISIKSGVKAEQLSQIDMLADALAASVRADQPAMDANTAGGGGGVGAGSQEQDMSLIDSAAMFKLSYGLFVLTARDGEKDNGCIINTAAQITSSPMRISITVNKANYTHDMVLKTGIFNVSILDQSVPFKVFQHFGFQSGKTTDKFADCETEARTENGVLYIPKFTNSVISGKVREALDYGTHTLFIADITQAMVFPGEPSVTYQYYFDNIKPKPQAQRVKKEGFVCKICGYVYEGDTLPDDYICPLCKHGADDFERL